MHRSFLGSIRAFILSCIVLAALCAASGQDKKPKTALDEQKNIQVFKTLPAAQLDPVMEFMASSLGVRCNHCHVQDSSGWHFERDDKREKKTARKMIEMVKNLNEQSFGGYSAVSCYTCHRGSTEPAKTPVLPMAAAPQRPRGEDQPHDGALPTTEQVLAAYEKALGGADAMKKITSRVTKGASLDPQGREMPQEVVLKAPDKYLSTVTFREGMQRTQCYNAGAAWMSSPRGVRELPAEDAAELKSETAFFPIAAMRGNNALHVRGRDTVGGRIAYILAGPAGESEMVRYYFDSASGLLLREAHVLETPVGMVPNQSDYSDYRAVDGVQLPFMIRSSSVVQHENTTLRISSIEQNVAIDDKRFAMPEKKK